MEHARRRCGRSCLGPGFESPRLHPGSVPVLFADALKSVGARVLSIRAIGWLNFRECTDVRWPFRLEPVYIVNTMRRIHRLAGLLSALSLVASVAVTSGYACALPGGADTMAGMAMASAAGAASPVVGIDSTTGKAPAPAPAPRGLPSAPSACQSMVACAPTAVASQHVGISATSGAIVRVASVAVLPPSSETIAPELPPPRA